MCHSLDSELLSDDDDDEDDDNNNQTNSKDDHKKDNHGKEDHFKDHQNSTALQIFGGCFGYYIFFLQKLPKKGLLSKFCQQYNIEFRFMTAMYKYNLLFKRATVEWGT